MKSDKKFIRIPADAAQLIAALDDSERGRLFTALIEFDLSGKVAELSGNERIIFPAIIEKMKKDEKEREKAEAKHRYGEYGHVLLTDSEADKLRDRFGAGFDARIARLDRYKEQTGKVYRSDYMTVLEWARRDEEKSRPKSEVRGSFDTDEFFEAALKKAYR